LAHSKKISPPRWAQRFLEWYCRPELVEDLEGDLNEYFARNVERKGALRARIIYVIDVIKFFRPYTIRKLETWDMNLVINHFKTSGRNIMRNGLFSVINIVGLAVSMCVGLLMIAMMTDLVSYDSFHANYDRIYRVASQYEYNGEASNYMATSSLKLAKTIRETFTGVEKVTALRRGFDSDVTFGDKTIPLRGLWADQHLFDVFSFELVSGDVGTALREPFTVLLTEEAALKVFGHVDVVGKIVTIGSAANANALGREYTITGVMKDIPKLSHIQFSMLGSMATREITEKDNEYEMSWVDLWNTWTYVLLPDNKDALSNFQQNLAATAGREDKAIPHTRIRFYAQPLGEVITGKGPDGRSLGNPIGPSLGREILWILGGLSFVVVLSAGLNYTNLSIARSFRRTREIGIRKTVGARRVDIVSQFLVESLIISLCALVVAFGLFLFVKPMLLNLHYALQQTFRLELSPILIGEFFLFAIIVGLLAGLFPALFFASVNAMQVFRNLSAIPILKGLTMRKVLIAFQYCISVIAITATLIIHKQYKHLVNFDLGFTTSNVLNVRLQGNNADVLATRLSQLPEVQSISRSSLVTSIGWFAGVLAKNPNDPLDSIGVPYIGIDENYLPLHNHQFLAGENFKPKTGDASETEVIVSESLLKRFNIGAGDPKAAIGSVVEIGGNPLTIVGVVRDFKYTAANDAGGKEAVLRYLPREASYLNLKVQSTDIGETMAKIESIWKEIDNVHQLEARFYNEQIEAAFQGLSASMKIGSFLTILIVSIASIGLLGMVVYSTETRLREVSIRKVFGASEMRLLVTLSGGFLWLIAIAVAIGIPLTYFVFTRVILPEMTNHAQLGLFEMSAGVLVVALLAFAMIGLQTVRVARLNPADVLKVE
jgi:putative ABC transport system permease protein